jgi:hypothetical protein
MNKFIAFFCICLVSSFVVAQSFAPKPVEIGSTAIYKDSSIIVNWASHVEVNRGYLDIANPSLGFVNNGNPSAGVGKAEGNSFDIVSLGDSGVAIVTFDRPIENGIGVDFAVFENGFADDYLELAFVEVSSDGLNYVRFPATSEASTTVQIGPYEFSDCRLFNNLAGKYRQGYGTPFDLEELKDSIGIDLMHITHVKIIDVVGTINEQYGSFDQFGTVINDLYPTGFASGGFDLDAVGVINQGLLSLANKSSVLYSLYPNPSKSKITIETKGKMNYCLFDVLGNQINNGNFEDILILDFSHEPSGVYFIQLKNDIILEMVKIVIER